MEGLFIEGLFLQASLIFALGAQNIFVLESGLKKQHPLAVSFACFFCDLFLLTIGVAGAGSLFSSYSQLKILVGVIGVFFLLQYGLSKIFIPQQALTEKSFSEMNSSTLKKSILLSMTFSLLNPHAYLDAFVLIGGYSSKYPLLSERLAVGFGAAFYSLLWFLALTSASSFLKPIFSDYRRLRLLSAGSGLLLLFLSFRLSVDVYDWIVHGPHSPIEVKLVSYPFPTNLLFSSILY